MTGRRFSRLNHLPWVLGPAPCPPQAPPGAARPPPPHTAGAAPPPPPLAPPPPIYPERPRGQGVPREGLPEVSTSGSFHTRWAALLMLGVGATEGIATQARAYLKFVCPGRTTSALRFGAPLGHSASWDLWQPCGEVCECEQRVEPWDSTYHGHPTAPLPQLPRRARHALPLPAPVVVSWDLAEASLPARLECVRGLVIPW